ncbi:MAG TPA: ORF6N domain-containing protein [Candidatus Limnocylindrales bacterium]|nr:ORF6N domain-containing protein [Candidatus Limnocylindrales bacterium]
MSQPRCKKNAVKRDIRRFPTDFRISPSPEEAANMRFQFGTSKGTRGGRRYPPYAFAEHGAIMAANILKSPRAIEMSIFVVRAFIKMRSVFGDTKELAHKLAQVEAELKSRLDVHEAAIVDVLQRIMKILDPPPCLLNHLHLRSVFMSERHP